MSRFPQIRLAWALVVIGVIGLLFGWWSDRQRLVSQLARAQLEQEIQRQQIANLKTRLDESQRTIGFFRQSSSFSWGEPAEFLDAVRQTEGDEAILGLAASLQNAQDDDFHSSIRGLVEMVDSTAEKLRLNALTVLILELQEGSPRLAAHREAIAVKLTSLLESSTVPDADDAQAIHLLRIVGPEAASALPVLKTISDDDDHVYAVAATLSAAAIDPQFNAGRRLKELIEAEHRGWYNAAFHLHKHLPAAEAEAILKEFYATRETEAEREALIVALNQIP